MTKKREKKIVVVGTGYVGLPAALLWAKAGKTVVGVDINENVVRAINDRSMHLNAKDFGDDFDADLTTPGWRSNERG
jgi:UDP-N-acetyl-D-mannosaminuronic acid dehydrogenase